MLVSCNNDELKKLQEKRSTIGDLEINRYQISLITSIHDHVDVTKDGKTEHIIKVNTGDIDTIFLVQDTLSLRPEYTRLFTKEEQDIQLLYKN